MRGGVEVCWGGYVVGEPMILAISEPWVYPNQNHCSGDRQDGDALKTRSTMEDSQKSEYWKRCNS